jgi:hypothetical protein
VGIFNGAPFGLLSVWEQGLFLKRIPKTEPWVSLSAFSAHTEKASPPRLEGQAVRQHKLVLRRSRTKELPIRF